MVLYQPFYQTHTLPTCFFFCFFCWDISDMLSLRVYLAHLHISVAYAHPLRCIFSRVYSRNTVHTSARFRKEARASPDSFLAVEVKHNPSYVALESSRLGAKHVRKFYTQFQSTLGVGNHLFVVEGRHVFHQDDTGTVDNYSKVTVSTPITGGILRFEKKDFGVRHSHFLRK